MAILRVSDRAFRMDEFDELPTAEVLFATLRRIVFDFGAAGTAELLGSFRYGPAGVLGTVTTITQRSEDGAIDFRFSDFSADAELIVGLIEDGKYDLAQQVVLAGDDQIFGGSGDDVLLGYGGRDEISGGGGDDVLTGGLDMDQLSGGTGADTFAFLAIEDTGPGRNARDAITDFNRAEGDKIDLWQVDAVVGNEQNDPFTGIVERFTGAGAELRVRATANGFLVSGDVDGDRGADFSFLVISDTPLVASDFVL